MNNQIKLLEPQCWEHNEFGLNFNYEKFAELIVRECIELADNEAERFSNLDQEYCAMAMDNYRELIRLHFGVE